MILANGEPSARRVDSRVVLLRVNRWNWDADMPSQAMNAWVSTRAAVLDELLGVIGVIRGSKKVQRTAIQYLSRSFAVMLSAEFQGFCKDLHRECAEHFASLVPAGIEDVVLQQFLAQRLLDRGNPNPGNIGADFNRLGLKLFDEVFRTDSRVLTWRQELDNLNEWRNAVAHNDYAPARISAQSQLTLTQLRSWRSACNHLAVVFDKVLGKHLETKTGVKPW